MEISSIYICFLLTAAGNVMYSIFRIHHEINCSSSNHRVEIFNSGICEKTGTRTGDFMQRKCKYTVYGYLNLSIKCEENTLNCNDIAERRRELLLT